MTGSDGLRPLGGLVGAVAGDLAGRRLARRGTTSRPRPGRALSRPAGGTPSVEQVRQKASETLWWVKGHPSHPSHPAAAPAVCPMCRGAGWLRLPGDAESGWRVRTEACGCLAELRAHERWERALAASDITPELLRLSFGGYETSGHPSMLQGRDAALGWAEEVPDCALPWLFLYGAPGTGKTHLLASAFNLLLAAGRYPLYTLVPALLDYVREGLDAAEKGAYAARFKAVREAPILILDDLGAEQRSAWSDETLFKLVDARYRAGLPTAVASNVHPVDLEGRIASRLQDRALAVALLMSGPDYRLQPGQARSVVRRRRDG
ncbi:MAG: ATP-binding protein [Ktedonobacterales bacterium]